MNVKKEMCKKLTGVLLLSIFAVYFVGITSFPHIHEMGSERIVHSHPFSDKHNHSDQSISTIGQLSLFVAILAASFILAGANVRIIRRIGSLEFRRVENYASSYKSLRAPPVMVNL